MKIKQTNKGVKQGEKTGVKVTQLPYGTLVEIAPVQAPAKRRNTNILARAIDEVSLEDPQKIVNRP